MTEHSDPEAAQPDPSSGTDPAASAQDLAASSQPVDLVEQFSDPALKDWVQRGSGHPDIEKADSDRNPEQR
jgi:hypothetical protein